MILLHHSLFYCFCDLFCCCLSFLGCMSSCSCFFPSSFVFLLLCFLLFSQHMLFLFSFLSLVSLRVSRLIVLAVVFFSPCSSSFSSCVSSSPQAPCAHLKRKTMETSGISFCLPLGDLCENVLSKNHCFFFLWWMSFIHRTCSCWMLLEYVVRESGIRCRFFCCCSLVSVFGKEPSGSAQFCLLCLYSLDSLSSLFVLFLFCVFLLGAFWVLLCFFGMLFVILGLSFLHCSVLMLLLLLHVLAARLSVWVSGLPFYGNPLGGRLGMANREGSIYFLAFLIIGVFG